MTQPNKSGLRGCLTSRALRIVLFLLAILLLGSVFVYLLNDDDRGPVSPEMMDEAATGRNKSVYDTLDVLGNYLWRDVMKSWGRNPPRPCLRLRLLRSPPWLLPRSTR